MISLKKTKIKYFNRAGNSILYMPSVISII